jgi:hypothetical protein
MGWMPGMGANITEKQSRAYWSSISPLAITSYSVLSDGSVQLVVRNNAMYEITLSGVYLNDENALKSNVTLQAGETQTVYGYVTNSGNLCSVGGTFSYTVKLIYSSTQLGSKSFTGEKPLVGSCVNSGILGLWHFDEGTGTTASDSSGNGNDATLVGTVNWVTGKIGMALEFTGSGYVDAGNSSSLGPTPEVTFAAWVKPTSLQPAWAAVVQRKIVGHWYDAVLRVYNGNRWQFAVTDGTNWTGATSSSSYYQLNTWQHVAGTYSNGTIKLYVNGELVDTATMTKTDGTIERLYIGKYDTGPGTQRYFLGVIDEVRVYNRALTQGEIMALYNAGK